MFSILAPGKRIPPHDGPYKGVLRYHLGLIVPDAPVEQVGIRVGDQIRRLGRGREPRVRRHLRARGLERHRRDPGRAVRRRRASAARADADLQRGDDQADRVVAVHPGRQAPSPRVGAAVRSSRLRADRRGPDRGALPFPSVRIRRLVLTLVVLPLLTAVSGRRRTPRPARPSRTQAIPFTAATVTQTADGYDVAWKAPTSAGAVKVYAGTDPADVGTGRPGGLGEEHRHRARDRARARAALVLRAGAREGWVARDRRPLAAPRVGAQLPRHRRLPHQRRQVGEDGPALPVRRPRRAHRRRPRDRRRRSASSWCATCAPNTERASKPDKEIAGRHQRADQHHRRGRAHRRAHRRHHVGGDRRRTAASSSGTARPRSSSSTAGATLVSGATPLAQYKVFFSRIEDPDNLPTVMHCSAGQGPHRLGERRPSSPRSACRRRR